jgi:iron complex outermembrane receptor protein
MRTLSPVALACAMACAAVAAQAQQIAVEPAASAASAPTTTALPALSVKASADASAAGLSPAYAGGQVARGGRAGILGTKDNLETPFSITSYTNELIQDRQAAASATCCRTILACAWPAVSATSRSRTSSAASS